MILKKLFSHDVLFYLNISGRMVKIGRLSFGIHSDRRPGLYGCLFHTQQIYHLTDDAGLPLFEDGFEGFVLFHHESGYQVSGDKREYQGAVKSEEYHPERDLTYFSAGHFLLQALPEFSKKGSTFSWENVSTRKSASRLISLTMNRGRLGFSCNIW